MAEKKYTAKTRTVTPRPRSERLRRLGGSAAAASSTITNVDGSAAVAQTSAGHTHANKDDLDRLSLSADDYLLIQDTTEKVKAKSGYADEAGHSASSDKAKEAEKAENAEQWDGHVFGDYLDQPVRKGDGVAFKSATISDDVKSPDFSSGIVGGTGWRAWLDAIGKSHMEVDNLIVRAKALFAELEIRKVTFSGGNLNLSSAGSRIVKTVALDKDKNALLKERKETSYLKTADGTYLTIGGALLAVKTAETMSDEEIEQKMVYTRCYLYADDGSTRTENWWKVGDQALCQTFNIKSGYYSNVANRYYWRLVCGVGSEMLSDGKMYDYVDLYSKVPTTEGGSSVEVTLTDGTKKTLQGYDVSATNDYPAAGDVIVQVGSQTDSSRRSLIQLSVTGDNSPSIVMHAGIGSGHTPYAYHPVQTYSPHGTSVQSSYFKIVSSGDSGVEQPIYCNRGAYNAEATYGYHDEVSYNGSLYVYIYTGGSSTGKAPTDTTYWEKVVSAGRNAEYDVVEYAISKQSTTTSTTTAPDIYGSWSDVPSAVTSTYPYLWEQITHYDADGNAGTPYYVRVTGERGANGTSFTSRGKADYHVSDVEALQDVAEAPAEGAVALIDDEDGIKVGVWKEDTDWVLSTPSDGDAYVYDGDLFVASSGAWVNMGKIQGAKGDTSYVHYAWAEDEKGTGFTTDKSQSSGKSYMGVYSDFSEKGSTSYGDYAWTKIKGETGQDGVSAATYQLTTTQTIVNQSETANTDGSYSWDGLSDGNITTTAFGYVGNDTVSVTAKVQKTTNCTASASGAVVTLKNITEDGKPTEGSIDVGIYVGGVLKATITWRLYFNRIGTFQEEIRGSVMKEVASQVKTQIDNGNFVTTTALGDYVKSSDKSMASLKTIIDNGWSKHSYDSVTQQTADAINMSVKANYTGNLLKKSNVTLSAKSNHTSDSPHFVGEYKYDRSIAKGETVTLTANIRTATAGTTVYVNFHDGGKAETFSLASTTEAQTVSVAHTMEASVESTTKIDFNQGPEYSGDSNEVNVYWGVLLYGDHSVVDEWKATGSEQESKFILKPDKAGIVTTDGHGNSASIETSTDSGGTVKLKAANISLEGLVTANGGFKVDDDGSVTATGATINGIFLTKYPDGKAQLVINDGGLTYYADDADHTVIWSLGRSGNIVRNQTIDHWETVYLMKVPITSMEVYYDKKDGNSYYVVGKAFHKFVAGDNSTYTAYDGLVTESSVTDSTSPSSVTGITGNYVAGSSEGSAIMQTTSGKYTQERYIYTSGKADKETTTCTSDTPIDINTLTDIS